MSWFRLAGLNRIRGRRVKAALLLGLFLSVFGMATSAQLHQVFHPTAGQADHHCAATMLASGKVDAAPSVITVPVAALLPAFVVWFEISSPSVASFNLPLSRGPPALLS